MAQRFGGPNSPGGDPRPPGSAGRMSGAVRQRPAVGARVNILFVLPFAFAVSAFFRSPSGLILHLAVFALMMASAWMTREGVIAQAAFDARKIARRPALPRKLLGSVLMGLGIGLPVAAGMGIVQGTILGLLGAALHSLAFGTDPMRDKGMAGGDGVDAFQTDRVARAVAEAEQRLAEMIEAIARLNDRALNDRLRDFAAQVRPLLRAVEDDPRQLSAARRYLGLYLDGARDATVRLAGLDPRSRDAGARADYLALLDDLQRNFAHRLATLESADRQALDIEIEVLRERLAREGIRPVPSGPQSPDTPSAPRRGTDHA